MEPKIGEIFEYNVEWYQCIKKDLIINADGIINYCEGCAIAASGCDNFNCIDYERSDKESVIFKKLEKVGEPYTTFVDNTVQNYLLETEMSASPEDVFTLINNELRLIAIEIKQNKDMKTVRINKDDLNFLVNKIRYGILPKCTDYDEITSKITDLFSVEDVNLSNTEKIGKNLKPFDLEAAKSGKPVCTRDGRKARIICFDRKDIKPIVALVTCINDTSVIEKAFYYFEDGYHLSKNDNNIYDLMMLPEKKEGWVNVYKKTTGEYYMDKIIHKTEKFASDVAHPDDYIDTVKISWEE